MITCHYCDKPATKDDEIFSEDIYSKDNEKPSETISTHYECIHDDIYDVFWCEICGKYYYVNPDGVNWVYDVEDTPYCRTCFKQKMLQDGTPISLLEVGELAGTYYTDKELKDAEYKRFGQAFDSCDFEYNSDVYFNNIKRIIECGYRVIFVFDRESLFGVESFFIYVSENKTN